MPDDMINEKKRENNIRKNQMVRPHSGGPVCPGCGDAGGRGDIGSPTGGFE
jgi:hypothetical protein